MFQILVELHTGSPPWVKERTRWDDWCATAEFPSIFCTADWLQSWWEIYGKGNVESWILAIRDGDSELIGYAPLMRVLRSPLPGMRVRSVEFIGTGERVCPEYQDVVAAPGKAETVRRAVVDYLALNHREWDRLWLTDSLAAESLSRTTGETNWPGCERQTRSGPVCPYRELAVADWEEFLGGMSKHMRRKVRQIGHRIEREFSPEWRYHRPDDDPQQAVELMTELHTQARNLKGEIGNFTDDRYRRFHTKIIERTARTGQLQLGILRLDQRPAAFYYGFIFAKRFFNYQTGFAPEFSRYRPGWYALALIIRDLIKQSCVSIDFLRGDHDYKWHWADHWHETTATAVFSRSLSGKLAGLLQRGRQRLHLPNNERTGPPDFVLNKRKKKTPAD